MGSPPNRPPSLKVSADYRTAMERIRGMIETRQGTAGIRRAAQDIARTYGVNTLTARRMLLRPETLALRELAILMTWLGHRIQFKTVVCPPPLEAPPLRASRAPEAAKAREVPPMDLETWKAWVEENRRKETTRGPYDAR